MRRTTHFTLCACRLYVLLVEYRGYYAVYCCNDTRRLFPYHYQCGRMQQRLYPHCCGWPGATLRDYRQLCHHLRRTACAIVCACQLFVLLVEYGCDHPVYFRTYTRNIFCYHHLCKRMQQRLLCNRNTGICACLRHYRLLLHVRRTTNAPMRASGLLFLLVEYGGNDPMYSRLRSWQLFCHGDLSKRMQQHRLRNGNTTAATDLYYYGKLRHQRRATNVALRTGRLY